MLAITATASPAVVSPDGDGHADAGMVSYRLGRSALVTATLLDPLGTVLATIPQGEQTAGAHTLTWPAEAYPDGPYSVLLSAQAAGRQVTATVPVSVNRTLAGLAVSAPAFSPALGALSYSFALTTAADVTVYGRAAWCGVGRALDGIAAARVADAPVDGHGRRPARRSRTARTRSPCRR